MQKNGIRLGRCNGACVINRHFSLASTAVLVQGQILKDAKHQALSDPRFCDELNLLSRITQMGLGLLPIPKESSDAEHESDKTHRRPAGL